MTKTIKTRHYSTQHVQTLLDAGVHPLMAKLLASRGVQSPASIESALKHLIPPDLLTQNTAMAILLADLIAQQRKILVVGDYDADGATATAVAVTG